MKVLKEVFSKPFYSILALAVSTATFSVAVLYSNFSFLLRVWSDLSVAWSVKIDLVFSLLSGIKTNFSLFSAGSLVVISILFGINISLIVFYIKKSRGMLSKTGAGSFSGGIVAGILGIGCAACGSIILSSLLPFLGGSALLAVFPFHGGELSILAILLFVFSIHTLSKSIKKAGICEVG